MIANSMKPNVDELLPTRRSLVKRLKDWDDHESWRGFFNTYWKLIYSVAIKAGLGESEAQDVVQETVLSVAKKIRDFEYDPELGSFKGWLLKITRRRIIDHLRKRPLQHQAAKAAADNTARTPTANRIPDPASLDLDAVWEEEWRKNLVDAAIHNVKAKVKPEQYQLFDCYVLKQWPMRDVTRKLRVSMGQVYFAKYKISALIQKEVRALEEKMI